MATQPNRLSHLQASDIYDLLGTMANAEKHIDHTPGLVSTIVLEKLGLIVKTTTVRAMAKDKGYTLNGLNRPKDVDRLDALEARILDLENRLVGWVNPFS